MNKTAVVLLTLLASAPLHAQTVNFRAGGSLAKFHDAGAGNDQESIAGFTGGISVDIPAGGVAIRAGANWVRKGSHVEVGGQGVAIELNADYIEIPALLLIGTDGRNDSPHAFAAMGVSAGIRRSCTGTVQGITRDCEPGVKDYDLSGAIGGGFTVPLSFSLNFGMEVLYLHGLAGIDEDDTRTRTLTATAGFGFPLG